MSDEARGRDTALWIDDRYRGAHGIGRYAQEVIPRLALPWEPLKLAGSPSSPWDSLRRLPSAARRGLVYSPGYGALLGANRQILTIHDLIHLQTAWPGRAKYLAYYNGPVRLAVRRSRVVLTVSETSRRAIEEWIDDDRVSVVNAGIGCSDAFRVDGPAAEAAEPYLLYVGNMRSHKNVKTVLRALAGVDGIALRAIIPAKEADEARAAAADAGLSSRRLELMHDVDDDRLAALYRGALATAMPSTLEGFGLPALESIRCGTPVIYWEGCGAVAETVGSRGVHVEDAKDPVQWKSAIERLAGSPTRIASPEEADYSWDVTARLVSNELDRARS